MLSGVSGVARGEGDMPDTPPLNEAAEIEAGEFYRGKYDI
jgi:hypothetical protein